MGKKTTHLLQVYSSVRLTKNTYRTRNQPDIKLWLLPETERDGEQYARNRCNIADDDYRQLTYCCRHTRTSVTLKVAAQEEVRPVGVYDQQPTCEVKAAPVHAMKAYRGSTGIVPLIHNLGTKWR